MLPGQSFRINLYISMSPLNGDGLDDILASSEGGGDSMLRDDGILLLMSQPDGSYADATHNMDYVRTPVDRGEFTEEVFQIQQAFFCPSISMAMAKRTSSSTGWVQVFSTDCRAFS